MINSKLLLFVINFTTILENSFGFIVTNSRIKRVLSQPSLEPAANRWDLSLINESKISPSFGNIKPKTVEGEEGTITRSTYSQMAEELLSILLARYNRKGAGEDNLNEDALIEGLMKSLIEARLPFDPQTSLNGPLFVVLYQKGDALPFWEKYSRILPTQRENLKGQRYVTLKANSDEDKYEVTNYAEFFGRAFSVQASATCERNDNQPAPMKSTLSPSLQEVNNVLLNLFDSMTAMFAPSRSVKLLSSPQDFTISVTGANVRLFGNTINIGVKGNGYLRVLYADTNLRIFTVPKDNPNEFVNEKVGLTVVQVRIDLIDPSFPMEGT